MVSNASPPTTTLAILRPCGETMQLDFDRRTPRMRTKCLGGTLPTVFFPLAWRAFRRANRRVESRQRRLAEATTLDDCLGI